MRTYQGQVREIRLDHELGRTGWIACSPQAIPPPGRYLPTWLSNHQDEPLAVPLFASEVTTWGFCTAQPLPASWMPGMELVLLGPQGRGFSIPTATRHLALGAFGDTAARLLPLITNALDREADAALFTDCPLPALPSALEIHPLADLPDVLGWADFLALDLNLEDIPVIGKTLGLSGSDHINGLAAQALVASPMPCGGIAECGVCAMVKGRWWKLACKHGPVFDLQTLI